VAAQYVLKPTTAVLSTYVIDGIPSASAQRGRVVGVWAR
jgi:hypothetical protein